MRKSAASSLIIYTIGHSNRTREFFLRLLQAHGITQLVDVRTVPRSRKHPDFNQETLSAVLKAEGIHYVHFPGLGGWRKTRPDSPNTGWRNESFRGYADYMQTPEFTASVEELIAFAKKAPTAIMCAEAMPYRCHRSLIADALTIRRIEVRHISSLRTAKVHPLTPWAKVRGKRITYPETAQAA